MAPPGEAPGLGLAVGVRGGDVGGTAVGSGAVVLVGAGGASVGCGAGAVVGVATTIVTAICRVGSRTGAEVAVAGRGGALVAVAGGGGGEVLVGGGATVGATR